MRWDATFSAPALFAAYGPANSSKGERSVSTGKCGSRNKSRKLQSNRVDLRRSCPRPLRSLKTSHLAQGRFGGVPAFAETARARAFKSNGVTL